MSKLDVWVIPAKGKDEVIGDVGQCFRVPVPGHIHARIVVPIDWDKVYSSCGNIHHSDFDEIRRQVEKQLAGE